MPEYHLMYEDLVSGDSILLEGVGHIHSPKLSDMSPTKGIGWSEYNLMVFFLRSGKEQFEKFFDVRIESDEQLFQSVIANDALCGVFEHAFDFFFDEHVLFNKENGVYVCYIDGETPEKPQIVGLINDDNFEFVRSAVLLLNYITEDKTNVKTKHSSKEAEAAWAKVQKYLAEQTQSKKEDAKMSFGNMLSKLCAIHPSINYLNVFDLTVFQFYDTFFQTCYMRSINFTEAVVSTNGSKNFKYGDWLNPIQTY